MNINPATASMAQQYSNTFQATAQPMKTPEQNVQVQPPVPEEPSKEARPVNEASESSVGNSVDVYA